VRRIAIVVSLVVIAAALWYFRPWDPHMSAGAVERAMGDGRQGTEVDCSRSDFNDGSLNIHDVDYACVTHDHGTEYHIWVGTDWHHITERAGWGP
jgi:hypothetical protein